MPELKKQEEENESKPKIRVKIKAYDHKVIDQSAKQIVETALRNGASVRGPVPLPTEISKFTLNSSTFVHKDARDQYEMRVHKRLVDIFDLNPKIIDSLTNLNLPAGVSIEIKM
ncbi:MAG: 30S ribosomal protein S10 [Candidatus Pacebacteria bacterium]|nr:30S ribosomal protein S10 [Candidatus Paceibacterota bacterium]